VWPEDIENVLRDDPAVKDAAVVPVATANGGLSLHAYLIPDAASTDASEPREIIRRANSRLAQHQRVTTARWWEEADFPRTSTLKVRRHLLPLPSQAEEGAEEGAPLAHDLISEIVAGVAKVPGIRPGQTLGELGLDSLGLVDLALSLEEMTGKTVTDGDLHMDMTVEDIRLLIEGSLAAGGGAQRDGGVQTADPAEWPYRWGRIFRVLDLPFRLIYRLVVPKTTIIGGEHLRGLPDMVILAGTHRSFGDLPLVRHTITQYAGRSLVRRLVAAASAGTVAAAGAVRWIAILAFGVYPLRQYSDREGSLRRLVHLMEIGNALIIFPQGTHARVDEELASAPRVRFRSGFAHIVKATNATVIPFGLAGTERIIPPRLDEYEGPSIGGIPLRLRRSPLAIALGPPVTIAAGESEAEFTARFQEVCFRLAREAEAALRNIEHRGATPSS
jgi:long-chain acyl-CoA synthetase